jgi:arylsulfatase A-like enzyme
MSGRYPMRYGLQHSYISTAAPYGLNLNETTVADALKRVGYKTHAVGKWYD